MPLARRKMLKTVIRAAAQDEKGAIAIIFALTCFLCVLATGLAVDVGRVMHAERTLSHAIDAAALAAAKAMRISGLNDAEVRALAQRYFEANIQGNGGSYAQVRSFEVLVNRANNSVAISVESDVPTLFGNVGGISKVNLPTGAVAIFDSKDVEIGLQLDVTGSMCHPCSKIRALKDAVAGPNGLLDILLPDNGTTNRVRIGLAPFAAGVNAGAYAAAVSDGQAASDGCVYERLDLALQPTDTAPFGHARFKARSESPGARPCPRPENRVVALTDDKQALRSAIQRLTTGGATAGHLGATWAWGLVSPNWASVWGGTSPAPYGDGTTEKYVILMTDGIYNSVGGVSNGDHGSTARQSRDFAEATCSAMKNRGVIVFTVGFQTPNEIKDDLRRCASSPARYYDATDDAALKAAFRAIAEEINSLRLSS